MNRQTVDVEKIAEAVLYEGYLLFPYRRSAMKNQQRWTFGGVYPREYSEANGGDDPWRMQTQCLVAGSEETAFEIKLRFLHVVDRKVAESGTGTQRFVDELRVGDLVHRPWEEAMEREILSGAEQGSSLLRLCELMGEGRRLTIEIPAGIETELLLHPDGTEAGAIVREWRSLQETVEIRAERMEGQDETASPAETVYRLTVRIENTTPWPNSEGVAASRNDALRQASISTHTILRVHDGAFLSLLEPPEAWQQAAGECANIKTWPVLVGEPGERHTLLSSPIILYDYPQISPESQGNYFDATEIDELLALSVLTLTDEEKQEMRESDLHAREILERTEALSEEQLLKMHGVVRYLQPLRREERPSPPLRSAGASTARSAGPPFSNSLASSVGEGERELNAFWEMERPAPESVVIDGIEVTKNSRVRLHPRAGGDIMDMALAGRVAYVESIAEDFEDKIQLAVIVEDDPGKDLGEARQPGHRFFFGVDEVEPLGADW